MAMTLTSKAHPYKAGFEPFASDVYRIPFAYEYRAEGETTAEAFAHHLENAFKRYVAAESVAAVIAEPVLGEGGFVIPPRDYFKAIHAICRKHGILFIADEVQSGFARTGKWFASEHFGIEPDLILTAKSLGGGMPIAAVTGRAEIMDAPAVGGLGGTFCGHPLSCAAALAAIETIEKDGLLARSTALGKHFEKRARSWQQKWQLVGDIRGLGGMCAIELVRNAGHARTRRHRNQANRGILLQTRTRHDHRRHVQQRHPHPRAARDHRSSIRRRPRRDRSRTRRRRREKAAALFPRLGRLLVAPASCRLPVARNRQLRRRSSRSKLISPHLDCRFPGASPCRKPPRKPHRSHRNSKIPTSSAKPPTSTASGSPRAKPSRSTIPPPAKLSPTCPTSAPAKRARPSKPPIAPSPRGARKPRKSAPSFSASGSIFSSRIRKISRSS